MERPPLLVFGSWKGGVGKSTLSLHVASLLDAVLVDLEPWGAATSWWGGRHGGALWQSAGGSVVLRALASGKAPRPRRGTSGRPRLVPSHEQLLALGEGQSQPNSGTAWAWTSEGLPALMVETPGGPCSLTRAIAEALPRWAEEWGRPVVVDTPAGFSPLADGAIIAADVLVVPVTLDQHAVPAVRKFMAAYSRRIRAGLVVPNRVQSRVGDGNWGDVIRGVVAPPFVLGPPVLESELMHVTSRPIHSGPAPGAARALVLHQVEEVAQRALSLARGAWRPRVVEEGVSHAS